MAQLANARPVGLEGALFEMEAGANGVSGALLVEGGLGAGLGKQGKFNRVGQCLRRWEAFTGFFGQAAFNDRGNRRRDLRSQLSYLRWGDLLMESLDFGPRSWPGRGALQ